MLIKTEVEIKPRRIADLMVSAMEGGCAYWCKSVELMSAYNLFKVGEEYTTIGGDKVKLIGVSVENEGTTYETMFDKLGIHRYTTRDFGRVTGTHDDPRSLLMPIWYDVENIYKERAFNKHGNFVPELRIKVTEADPHRENHDGVHLIYLKDLEAGFQLMTQYGKPKGFHFRNFIEENDDAETADVWFQLAVFGEVVYG